jgi:hypothetical protein
VVYWNYIVKNHSNEFRDLENPMSFLIVWRFSFCVGMTGYCLLDGVVFFASVVVKDKTLGLKMDSGLRKRDDDIRQR